MAGPLVVGAEGVILVPDDSSYASSRPVQEGIELIMQLQNFPTSRTVILCATDDEVAADHYLKVNGLPKVNVRALTPEDKREEPATAQWYSIERERAAGPVNLVITAWNSVFERCKASHQPVLLFGRRGALGALDNRASWHELHERVIRSRDAAVFDGSHETIDYE